MFEAEIAIYTPEIKAPGKRPEIIFGPNKIPKANGVTITKAPGAIISFNEAYVEILTQPL